MQFDCAFQALIELAASRHNAFSTSEAAKVNVTPRRLRDALASGVVKRLYPGVWAIRALPDSEHQKLRAATLTLPGSAVTRQSAAWLHGWIDRPPTPVQIWSDSNTTPRQSGITVNRFARIDPVRDVTEVDHIPVLSKAAALCLLGADCDHLQLELSLDEFLRTNSERWLYETLDRLYSAKAPGPHALLRVVEDPMRVPGVAESVMERTTAQLLAIPELPPMALQHELTVRGRRFRIDLACPEIKLGVEFHSRQFHWGRKKQEDDSERDFLISSAGWKLIYVTHKQVANPAALIDLFRQTAQARAKQLGIELPSGQ